MTHPPWTSPNRSDFSNLLQSS